MQVPGFYAGVDEQGALIEVGWCKWPTLMHLAWQGQWQHYLHHLHANLSRPALTVPVFLNQVGSSSPLIMPGCTVRPSQPFREEDCKNRRLWRYKTCFAAAAVIVVAAAAAAAQSYAAAYLV